MRTAATFDSGANPGALDLHALSPVRKFYWSVRRELWEHRSLYLAPTAVSALILAGFVVALIHSRIRGDLIHLAIGHHDVVNQPLEFAAGLMMGTTFVVGFFYCLDSLYGERRDRSILFWKSLPVSDWSTVAAKAAIVLFMLPLLNWALAIVTQTVMLLLSSAAVLTTGQSIAPVWSQAPLVNMAVAQLYHLVTVHSLWYAPIYGWLFFVSAWAKRAPFLWAILPPLALAFLEKIAFNTWHLAGLLGARLVGGQSDIPMGVIVGITRGHLKELHWLTFARNPGLWAGFAIMAAFLAAAVQLRRQRGPL